MDTTKFNLLDRIIDEYEPRKNIPCQYSAQKRQITFICNHKPLEGSLICEKCNCCINQNKQSQNDQISLK
jgi:hypothetical protein